LKPGGRYAFSDVVALGKTARPCTEMGSKIIPRAGSGWSKDLQCEQVNVRLPPKADIAPR